MKFSKNEINFVGINVKAIDEENYILTIKKKNRVYFCLIVITIICLRVVLAIFYKI